MTSIFAEYENKIYKHRYETVLHIDEILGGVPADPKVIEGWIKKNLGTDNPALIAEMVAQTLIERGVEKSTDADVNEAVEEVVNKTKLNGFKRDDDNGLYIEGRQCKAMLKEAANVAWPKRKWGPTNKFTRSYIAEHLFVPETKVYLGVHEPSGVLQRFVSTWRGTSPAYNEYVVDAKISFTVMTDSDEFDDDDWAALWVRAQNIGLGASRSQGYGKFQVVQWNKIGTGKSKSKK